MAKIDSNRLQAEYDNRARVAEHPAILRRWAGSSAQARDRYSRRIDIRYGNGPCETLDLFPTVTPRAPVLVFIHGGYWRSLDKSDLSFVAPPFVELGAMVVVPNHGLCPAASMTEICLQTARALAWTWRNAGRYGGDPSRIVVAGHSAGGHLAAMMLSCRWADLASDLPPDLVSSALAISGLFDLRPLRGVQFLQDDLRMTPAEAARVSPALFPAPTGRLAAVVGGDESDEFKRQTALIRKAWGERQVPVAAEVPGRNHFDVLHSLLEPEGQVFQLAEDLLWPNGRVTA